jgi:hypothetical protein
VPNATVPQTPQRGRTFFSRDRIRALLEHGPRSVRELSLGLGMTIREVEADLYVLQEAGHIRPEPGRARAWRLV